MDLFIEVYSEPKGEVYGYISMSEIVFIKAFNQGGYREIRIRDGSYLYITEETLDTLLKTKTTEEETFILTREDIEDIFKK